MRSSASSLCFKNSFTNFFGNTFFNPERNLDWLFNLKNLQKIRKSFKTIFVKLLQFGLEDQFLKISLVDNVQFTCVSAFFSSSRHTLNKK